MSRSLSSPRWLALLWDPSDEEAALLGAIQSLFEGSMYTFVFLWTPALSPSEKDIPHGFIFAAFMLSSMLGSFIASGLMARSTQKVESYIQIIFGISALNLLLPIITNFLVASTGVKGGSISFAICIQLFGFFTLEACVGIFWPSIMKMRSQYIPEEARSTIMNFFRIPLNIFVSVVLYNQYEVSRSQTCGIADGEYGPTCKHHMLAALGPNKVAGKSLAAALPIATLHVQSVTKQYLDCHFIICIQWLFFPFSAYRGLTKKIEGKTNLKLIFSSTKGDNSIGMAGRVSTTGTTHGSSFMYIGSVPLLVPFLLLGFSGSYSSCLCRKPKRTKRLQKRTRNDIQRN